LSGLYDQEVPDYDPAELERLLARAKARGAVLSARRRRSLRAIFLLTAGLVAGTSVAATTILGSGAPPTSPGRLEASGLRWALAGYIGAAWEGTAGRGLTVLGTFDHGLTCPSATTCYAEGATSAPGPDEVEATDNAGKTWHRAGLQGAEALSNVSCASARVCALLEARTDNEPLFVETTDGGTTWVARPAPSWPSPAFVVPGLINMSCWSAAGCSVVASSYLTSSALSEGPSVTSVTMDGGRTWSRSTPTFKPSWELRCFAHGNCLAAGPSGVAHSTDNGLRWALSSGWPSGTGAYFSCATSASCMASSEQGTGGAESVLVSSDGGESWSRVSARGLPVRIDLASLACPTSSGCWLSGNSGWAFGTGGVLLSSATGGRTWSASLLPRGVNAVWAVSCPRPKHLFCFGQRGISACNTIPRARALGPRGASSLVNGWSANRVLSALSSCRTDDLSWVTSWVTTAANVPCKPFRSDRRSQRGWSGHQSPSREADRDRLAVFPISVVGRYDSSARVLS
jgi:photosystem II stability/assembly factor-like uncharacterized protein